MGHAFCVTTLYNFVKLTKVIFLLKIIYQIKVPKRGIACIPCSLNVTAQLSDRVCN